MERIRFVKAVFVGLAKEATTNPELMVLTVAGLALASRSRPLRGIGIGMTGWYVTRKADTYVAVLDSKLRLIAGVIDAGNSTQEANGQTSTRTES